jgi:two-component SAPR family response regulator
MRFGNAARTRFVIAHSTHINFFLDERKMTQSLQDLEQALTTASNEKEKAVALNKLASELYSSNPARAVELSQQSEHIALENGLHDELAFSLRLQAVSHNLLDNYTAALEEGIKALEAYEKLNAASEMILMTGIIAVVHSKMGHTVESIDYNNKSIQLAKAHHDLLGEANALNNLGIIYANRLVDYAFALELYQRALTLHEELKHERGICITLLNIAAIYAELDASQDALLYLNRALIISEKNNFNRQIPVALSSIAQIHSDQNDFPTVMQFALRALKMNEAIGSKSGMAQSMELIGVAARNLDSLEVAETYLTNALALSQEIGFPFLETQCLLNVGMLHEKKKDIDAAISAYISAVETAKTHHVKYFQRTGLERLSQLYYAKGDSVKSLLYKKQYQTINHEIFSEASAERLKKSLEKLAVAQLTEETSSVLALTPEEDTHPLIRQIAKQQSEKILRLQQAKLSKKSVVIEIRTFGTFTVLANGNILEQTDWQRKKTRDVFKILLLNYQKPVTTDELQEHLWSSTDYKSFEPSLHKSISQLRRALRHHLPEGSLQDVITTNDKTYTLDFGDSAFVDFIEFRRYVADARRSLDARLKLSLYQMAIDLYAGDFLKENLPDDWTSFERETLKDSFLEALASIGLDHVRQTRYDAAINTAEKILALEPVSEIGYTLLFSAHQANLHSDNLRRAVERCRIAYKKELGVPIPDSLKKFFLP